MTTNINSSRMTKEVEEIGQINFTGNITPHFWYQNICYESGRPNINAIIILGEITYWYRPTELVDEVSGKIIGYQKKFKSDLLQKTYASLGEKFGLSKRQTTDACHFLKDMGLIDLVFRTQPVGEHIVPNILFIKIFPEKIKQITFQRVQREITDVTHLTFERDTPHILAEDISRLNVTLPPAEREYTKNTSEITQEITDQIKDPCKSPSGTERVLAERVVTRMPVATATSSAVADTPNLELELVFEKESSEGEMGVKVARKARPKKDKRQKLTTSEYQRFQDTYNNHKPQSFARMVVVNAVREDVIDKLVQDFGGVEEALNVLEKAMKQACQEQWCRGLVLSFENFASNNKFLTHYEGWLAVNQKDTPAPSPQNLDPWTMLPIPLRRAYMLDDKRRGLTEEEFNRNQREQQVIWFAENGFPELSQKLALKLP